MLRKKTISTLLLLLLVTLGWSQSGPTLILTEGGARNLREALGQAPLLDKTFAQTVSEVDAAMLRGIDVPIPKDLAGGYTHEQHKSNFFILQKAGVLFQVTQEEKYAQYVKEMLFAYKDLYPTVDRHPATRSYARGKFFWQCLNDANWLVYMSQAYDCIYHWLPEKDRKTLNQELFRPYADFLSVENPQFFNRIHNHSTWGNAAVGMIGLVMDDDELVQRALYDLDQAVPGDQIRDNDGGLITLPGQNKAGFLAQIDEAFSPDGYYTEGPYYQRYAMYPFLIFAEALANKRPELGIVAYRDSVLIKGVYALLNLTNTEGEFFPINDAQKGMSVRSRELVTAVSFAYHFGQQDASLLSVVALQNRVPLDDTGLSTASAMATGEAEPFTPASILLRDGASGTEGAIGVLRSGDFTLVMKYAKHGMGHGHFDKLSFSYYHGSREVFQDYGAARWVNVEQKDGGGYLTENRTWAKQTVAHNTLVIDRTSQFEANTKTADQFHGEPYLFMADNPRVQLMSAKDREGYADIVLHRTMALLRSDASQAPLVLDLFRVESATGVHTYELPFYFQGEFMQSNFPIEAEAVLRPMGEEYGYQHLWAEAKGTVSEKTATVNWLQDDVFYTWTAAASADDQVTFGRIGANDPKFNLRRDPVFLWQREGEGPTVFASVTEAHGRYSAVTERVESAYSQIKALNILSDSEEYTAVEIIHQDGTTWVFAMANQDSDPNTPHTLAVGGNSIAWTGPVHYSKIDSER
ncbi:MAG TPA: heparinase [Cytophagales bacterium]|nr:heparinase [Cytophagales bacterium]